MNARDAAVLTRIRQELADLRPLRGADPPASVLVAHCAELDSGFVEINSDPLNAWLLNMDNLVLIDIAEYRERIASKDWSGRPYYQQGLARFAQEIGSERIYLEMAWGGLFWETVVLTFDTAGGLQRIDTHSVS